MFCSQCGKEISDVAAFCPNCGKAVKDQKKEKNNMEKKLLKKKSRYLPVGLAVLVVVILATLAGVLLRGSSYSDKRALKAYKKFYHEFYEENAGGLSVKEAEQFDCTGKIIMGSDGKLMMSIVDITYISEDGSDGSENLYLYSYERGKVVEKAEMRDILIDDGVAYFVTVGENLYFTYDNWNGSSDGWNLQGSDYTYIFNEKKNKFEEVKWKLKDGADKEKADEDYEPEDYETEQGVSYETLVYMTCYNNKWTLGEENASFFLLANSANLINGKDFEKVLDELTDKKINNQLDLQVLYGNMIKELNVWGKMRALNIVSDSEPEYPIVTVTETEDGYYGIRTSKNAVLLEAKNKDSITDVSKLLEEVNGHKVTGIGARAFSECEKLETAEIPDNITYIEESAFLGCSSLKKVIVPDSVTRIGDYAFLGCAALEEIEIPDSVEKIGEGIFYEAVYVIVFCNQDTAIQDYVEENNIYYINGTIDTANKEEVEKRKEEIKKEKELKEAISAYQDYISSNDLDNDYAVYNLLYIDSDYIPEMLFDNTADGRGTLLLSYVDGQVCVNDDIWCRGFELFYIPGKNKIEYLGAMSGEGSGGGGHLENGFLVVEHSYSVRFNEAAEEQLYEFNGNTYSMEDFVAIWNTYFDSASAEYGWTTYSSISEAYENLDKEP